MRLFDDTYRSYLGPSNHNENPYDFYNRSARNDISIIRNTLEEWFQEYPNDHQKELKNSFVKNFDDCFYELFLYKLFKELGFEIEIHPTLPKSTKRPDFLIQKNEQEIYVEAKIVKNKSNEQEALDRKINEFYDSLSKIDSKGFLLQIDTLIIKGNNQPSTKKLIQFVEREIQKLDPDVITTQLQDKGTESIPVIEVNDDQLHLIIKPMPVIAAARNKKKRPIDVYPIETFWGAGEESLKESISKKAKRYGELDKPFIVCVNSLDMRTSGTIDIENAIWGSIAISWSTDPNNHDEKWIRKKDGLFLDEKGPRLENLSGTFISKVVPHNIPNANYWLFQHPFTTNNLDFESIGLKFSYVKDSQINRVIGDDLDSILSISKNWLNE
ncbi:hypothetical protein AAGF08_14150 [Algoriphagus sp. SE2]|uniref:hypothetical protein n=1 Tax=Algoriphagus sp. SE2 TaxID=3141536 RepID=UPI0031CD6FEA